MGILLVCLVMGDQLTTVDDNVALQVGSSRTDSATKIDDFKRF